MRPQLAQNTEKPLSVFAHPLGNCATIAGTEPLLPDHSADFYFAQTLSLNTDKATACNVFEASQSFKAASPCILVKLRTAVMTSGKAQCNEMYKNKAASWT